MANIKSSITKEQFKEGYMKRSKLTEEDWNRFSMKVVSCNCDYEQCLGWSVDTQDFRREDA